MKRFILPLLLAVVVSEVQAQEAAAPKTKPGFQLRPLFKDDFSKDTRKQYQIKGDVQWKSGSLTMAEGAALRRKLDAGEWVELTLQLEFPKLGDPGGQSAAALDLQTERWPRCRVEWEWFYEKGAVQGKLRIYKFKWRDTGVGICR